MRFGLKLWSSNTDMIPGALELIRPEMFRYIELTVIPGTDILPWLGHEVPFIIHATTERNGFNIGTSNPGNAELLENSIRWADKLEARHIVLHPGFGNLETALGFLEGIDDTRILIENMPKVGMGNESMLGFDKVQLRKLMGNKFGLCLDVNHAMKAAISLGADGIDFIKELEGLNSNIYHVADGSLSNEKDEHLHLGQGEYDLAGIMNAIGESDKPITLETPRRSLGDDLINLRYLKSLI